MVRQAALSVGVLGLIAAAGCSGGWSNAKKLATYEAVISDDSLDGARSVSIRTVSGDVLLEPTDSAPRVIGKVRATTQLRAEATTISTTLTGDTLEISVNWPDGERKKSEGCDLLVYVPTMTGVTIDTSGGDIFVKEMAGLMDIRSSAGDIEVHEHDGSITVKTSAGDIDFWDISGPVDIVTSAGDITLRGVDTPTMVKTSAGDLSVVLNAGATGTLEASTTVGNVRLHGTRFKSRSGSVTLTDEGPKSRFRTSAGDIEVTVKSE